LHARILRFEAALDSKARFPDKSWADVAQEFGYYDQMHMIHDFRRFTGDTPSNILRQLEEVFRGEMEAVRRGRSTAAASGLDLIL
jgi:AraC-like DNA-binding protein